MKFAAKELQDITKQISGAELPIVSEHSGKGLEIVLATPDTVPEIKELFAEDLKAIGEEKGQSDLHLQHQ